MTAPPGMIEPPDPVKRALWADRRLQLRALSAELARARQWLADTASEGLDHRSRRSFVQYLTVVEAAARATDGIQGVVAVHLFLNEVFEDEPPT